MIKFNDSIKIFKKKSRNVQKQKARVHFLYLKISMYIQTKRQNRTDERTLLQFD